MEFTSLKWYKHKLDFNHKFKPISKYQNKLFTFGVGAVVGVGTVVGV